MSVIAEDRCYRSEMTLTAQSLGRTERIGAQARGVGGGGATPYKGLYGEAPPVRTTFFRLQVLKGVGISQVEVYKRVGKSVS